MLVAKRKSTSYEFELHRRQLIVVLEKKVRELEMDLKTRLQMVTHWRQTTERSLKVLSLCPSAQHPLTRRLDNNPRKKISSENRINRRSTPIERNYLTVSSIRWNTPHFSSPLPFIPNITKNGVTEGHKHWDKRGLKRDHKQLIATELQRLLTGREQLQNKIQTFVSDLSDEKDPIYFSILIATEYEDGKLSHSLSAKMWNEISHRLCQLKLTESALFE
ncbi:hypothetical protein FGIG_08618 [Fasciola gigantica]|uniref:Uncharacterized protein n=1 Tax=Fasciola gigantica TaxID=46835 RepID=A0A504YL15_FASGI|nr:hypothetical protein FGIG_08618 [Fasciola gigantica]